MEREFNKTEEKLLLYLKKKHVAKGEWEEWTLDQIEKESGISRQELETMLPRFLHLDILKRVSANIESGYFVKSPVMEYAAQLEHKPPPNYWNEWLKWFFSSRWRTVIFFIFLAIPTLVKWIEMLKMVLDWWSLPLKR
jgi:hypothetical protein